LTKTVIVTGGAGYVGSHACKAFAQAGWTVVVYDNLSRGHRDFVRWGDLVEGDIRDRAKVEETLRTLKPDAVAHFAALAYVNESVNDPAMYYDTNVMGTISLLDGMRAAGVDKLLFSSTCATYGVPATTPIDETFPQFPINPYGWTKLMIERALIDYSAAYDLRYVALRYFNAAGADPDGEVGERHDPEPHVIPLAIEAARKGDKPFNILGTDFDTRDGTCVRDYIHVTDLGDAHARALDYLMKGGASDIFNLGTGNGTTVKEIADAVERRSNRPLTRILAGRRAGDPPALVADAAKAETILGWKPTHSSISEIIDTAWRWHDKEDRP
jgi:UDP-arabinose 4-epimerase